MTTQARPARAKHVAQNNVIDIDSSPEPRGRTRSASRTRITIAQTRKGKKKASTQSNTRTGKMVMGPVIELTDSDSDSEQGPRMPNGHNHQNNQAQAGPSRPKPFPMLLPQRSNSTLTALPAAASLENIPIASGSGLHKKRKALTSAPLFPPSQSDEENDPPVIDEGVVLPKKVKLAEQEKDDQAADDEWDPEMQPYPLLFYEERGRGRNMPGAPDADARVPVARHVAHPPVRDPEQVVAPVPRPNPAPTPAPPALVPPVQVAEPIIPVEHEPEPEPQQDPTDRTIAQILEIIPDVEPDHLRGLVETHLPNFGAQTTEHILGLLFENGGYPRVDKSRGKRKAVDDEGAEDNGGRPQKKVKVDYASVDRDPGGSVYYELALVHLQISFPLVPKPFLRRMLEEHNRLYVPTHLAVAAFEKAHNDRDPGYFLPYIPKSTRYNPAKDLRTLRASSDKAFAEERKWLIQHLQNPIETKVGVVGAAIVDVEQEAIGKGKGKAIGEEEDDAPLEDGTGIECQCCFSEYAFDKMVQCPETHLFCSSCVSQYAATKLGEHNPSIVCMHASGCAQPFTESELRRILSPKLMALYERVKQQKEIQEAGLEGLEECPFCEWKCVLEASNEEEKLFRCGNEEGGCGVVSCRKCKKKDHLPKSCKEVEEDNVLDGRHVIEEAMTRALMRNCPKCNKAFVKEAGCNKMTCPHCRTLSCYVCRQVIADYHHFDQTPSGQPTTSRAGGKCRLWDNVEERHAVEVRAAAEKAAADYKRDHPEVDEEGIKVDLPVVPPPPPPAVLPGNRVFHAPMPHLAWQNQHVAMLGVIVPPPPPPIHAPLRRVAQPMQVARRARAHMRLQQEVDAQQRLADERQLFPALPPLEPIRPFRQTRAQVQQHLHQQLLLQQQQRQAEARHLEQQRQQELQRVELQQNELLAQQNAFLVQQQEVARLNAEFAHLQRITMEQEQLQQARAREELRAQQEERANQERDAQVAANARIQANTVLFEQHRREQQQQRRMLAAQQVARANQQQRMFAVQQPAPARDNRVFEDALRRHNEERARQR